jgi:hypothetical protein
VPEKTLFETVKQQVLLSFTNTANPRVELEKIFLLWLWPRGEEEKLKETAGISFILSISEGLDRYIQPFKFLFISASWLINIALITTIIVTALPGYIMQWILQRAEKLLDILVNWISNGEYNNQMEDYKNSEFEKARQQKVKEAMQNLSPNSNWDEDSFFAQQAAEKKTTPEQCRLEFDTDIKINIQISLFQNFKFILRSLYRAIHPLANVRDPARFGKKVLAIFSWPLRLIFAAILLAASAAAAITTYATSYSFRGVLALYAAVKVASLFVLNLPRYLFNAPGNLIQGLIFAWHSRGKIAANLRNLPPNLYQRRFDLLRGVLLAGAATGFAVATFGIAPMMMAIAAGVGALSSFITSNKNLAILNNSYVKGGLVVLTLVAAAASVLFTAGASIPVIASILPFTLPQIILPSAILLKAGIAVTIGLITTIVPTVIMPGVIKLLSNIKDLCFKPRRPKASEKPLLIEDSNNPSPPASNDAGNCSSHNQQQKQASSTTTNLLGGVFSEQLDQITAKNNNLSPTNVVPFPSPIGQQQRFGQSQAVDKQQEKYEEKNETNDVC